MYNVEKRQFIIPKIRHYKEFNQTVLPKIDCLYGFSLILRINSYYFLKQR
jgi:hypothetical protein